MLNRLKTVDVEMVFAFCIVLFAVLVGRFFAIPPLDTSIIWPAIGLSFGFLLKYQKKVLPYLFAATFLGQSISNGFTNISIISLVIHPLVLSLHTVIILYIGANLIKRLELSPKMSIRNALFYTIITLFIAFIQAVLGSFGYYIFYDFTLSQTLNSVPVWAIGDFFGLIAFGVPLYYSLYLDKEAIRVTPQKEAVVFMAAFVLFTFLFFNPYFNILTFEEHKYVFMGFFVVIAFKFQYRMLYQFSFFILLAMIFYPPLVIDMSNIEFMMDVNVFLTTNTLVVLVLKHFLTDISKNEVIINAKKERLEKLINATQSLFTLSNDLNTLEDDTVHKQLAKTFRMIFDLFEKADYGSVALLTDKVYYIDAIGFNITALNSLNLTTENWVYSLDSPQVIKNTEQLIKADLKDKYEDYAKANPQVKNSVYLSLKLNDSIICEMSFDLKIDSEYEYTDSDLQYFKSLQKLIESYYSSQKLAIEYDEIKDDIVLSLLRTLELFDPDTKGHSLDVAQFARAMGNALKISPTMMTDLYWAGILHDVGKLGIDVDIVRKDTTLSMREYEEMKKHTLLGYEVLRESSELANVSEIVKYHHEAIDGSGYPEGLYSELIPYNSKILHVAEAVATMGRNQRYSKQKSKAEIIASLRKHANERYDIEIVNVAIYLIRKGYIDHYYT